MKIVFINLRVIHGGVEKQILLNIDSLPESFESVYVYSSHMDTQDHKCRFIQNSWRGFEKKGFLRLFTFIPFLIRTFFILRKEKPDVIHTYSPYENFIGFLFSKLLKIPHISSIRTNRGWAFKGISKWGSRSTFIQTNSYAINEYIKEKYPQYSKKVRVISNGLEQMEYRDLRLLENPVFGMMGRISPSKNQKLVIRQWQNLKKIFPGARLFIQGTVEDQAYMNELQALVERNGLSEDIRFKNAGDKYSFYDSIDVFLLPSRTEGVPNVILECMGIGIPWIASDIADLPYLAGDNERGFLFSDNDEVDFIGACKKLRNAQNKDIESMIVQARQYVQEQHSLPAMAKRFEALYKEAKGDYS